MMEQTVVKQSLADCEEATTPVKPEKILIVYDRQNQKWIAVPGIKVLSQGNTVQWRAIGCQRLGYADSDAFRDAFENIKRKSDTEFTADVKPGAIGYYVCPMTADGMRVEGG